MGSSEIEVSEAGKKGPRGLKFDRHKWLGLPFNALLLIFSLLLMQVIADLRFNEMSIALENVNQKGFGLKSTGLIARYQLIRAQGTASNTVEDKSILTEAQLMTVLSGEFAEKKRKEVSIPFLEGPARAVINTVNFLVGSEPLVNLEEDKGQKLLEMAYFYERKKQFNKSIFVYNAAIKHYGKASNEAAYIYLHRGFGLSLVGFREAALTDYDKVMSLDKGGELAITAEILSSFLIQTNLEIERIDRMVTSVNKGIAYQKVTANRRAIEVFNRLEPTRKGQSLYYHRGRAYEEIGQTKKAIADYKRVIAINPRTLLAKKANRRLYILSTFYGDNKKLKEETKKLAEKTGDNLLDKKLSTLEKAVDSKAIAKIKKDKKNKEIFTYVNEVNEVKPKKNKQGDDEEIDTSNFEETQKKVIKKERKEEKDNQNDEAAKRRAAELALLKKRRAAELAKIRKQIEERERLAKLEKERLARMQRLEKQRIAKLEKKWQNLEDDELAKELRARELARRLAKQRRRDLIEMISDPELSTAHRRRLLLSNFKKFEVIFTEDGDVIVGAVVSSTSEAIKIVTVYGAINVLKPEIVMRQNLPGGQVLK